MPSHRGLRMAEAIREVASETILFHLADPRVKGVTVTRAEISNDLRDVTVFVSIMGTEAEQRNALRGLQHASGFVQARVAARLQTRFTPTLDFKRDEGIKKSVEMSRMIDEALAADRAGSNPAPADRDDVHDQTVDD